MKTKKASLKKTVRKKTVKKPAKKPAKKTVKKTVKKAVKKTALKKTVLKKTAARITPVRASQKLLSAQEPLPYRIENPNAKNAGLVICDHASFRVPQALKDMGLKKSALKKHIGWDIGAEQAALHISRILGMPAVMAQYSRLVVDLNRAPDYCECMPTESDHIAIPANADLTRKDREKRLDEIYWPYHKTVARLMDRQVAAKKKPLLLSIHSLTPRMDGVSRPWHLSILWNKDAKVGKQVVRAIRKAHPGLLIGENEPYQLSGERFAGSTISRHAEARNLPYVLVEFRQDLINTKQKAIEWAEIFTDAVRVVLDDPATFAGRKIKPYKK